MFELHIQRTKYEAVVGTFQSLSLQHVKVILIDVDKVEFQLTRSCIASVIGHCWSILLVQYCNCDKFWYCENLFLVDSIRGW